MSCNRWFAHQSPCNPVVKYLHTRPFIVSLPRQLRTGAAWVAFARLEPFITTVIQNEFGTVESVWPESISGFYRELWRGEFDTDLTKVSALLPAHYDTRSTEMQKAP